MHGHFYGKFTGNLAHAQSVCTRPFSRGEGPGDEARGLGTRLTSGETMVLDLEAIVPCSSTDVQSLVNVTKYPLIGKV